MRKEERNVALRLSVLGFIAAMFILGMICRPLGHNGDVRTSAIDIGETVKTYMDMGYIEGKE